MTQFFDFKSLTIQTTGVSDTTLFFAALAGQSDPSPFPISGLAFYNYINAKLGLAAIARSGSASDLGAGTVPTGVLPGRLADVATASWAQGDVMYFNGTNLVRLPAGTSGQFLQTKGAGQNPVWASSSLTGVLLVANNLNDVASASAARTNLGLAAIAASGSASDLSSGTVAAARLAGHLGDIGSIGGWTQGDLIYYTGSILQRLGAGTAGQILTTQGTTAAPSWNTFSGLQAVNNLNDVNSASSSRANLSAANANANGQTDYISGVIPTVANGSYELVVNIPYGCTITKTTTICTGGTCTATWSSNGVNLGATNAVSTSQSAVTQNSNNAVTAGKDITLAISANSSCVNMSFTITYTYQLAT